jgi:hypothetical protein
MRRNVGNNNNNAQLIDLIQNGLKAMGYPSQRNVNTNTQRNVLAGRTTGRTEAAEKSKGLACVQSSTVMDGNDAITKANDIFNEIIRQAGGPDNITEETRPIFDAISGLSQLKSRLSDMGSSIASGTGDCESYGCELKPEPPQCDDMCSANTQEFLGGILSQVNQMATLVEAAMVCENPNLPPEETRSGVSNKPMAMNMNMTNPTSIKPTTIIGSSGRALVPKRQVATTVSGNKVVIPAPVPVRAQAPTQAQQVMRTVPNPIRPTALNNNTVNKPVNVHAHRNIVQTGRGKNPIMNMDYKKVLTAMRNKQNEMKKQEQVMPARTQTQTQVVNTNPMMMNRFF